MIRGRGSFSLSIYRALSVKYYVRCNTTKFYIIIIVFTVPKNEKLTSVDKTMLKNGVVVELMRFFFFFCKNSVVFIHYFSRVIVGVRSFGFSFHLSTTETASTTFAVDDNSRHRAPGEYPTAFINVVAKWTTLSITLFGSVFFFSRHLKYRYSIIYFPPFFFFLSISKRHFSV